jgi:hypothetical protein
LHAGDPFGKAIAFLSDIYDHAAFTPAA